MNADRTDEETCDPWVAGVGDDIARDLVDPLEIEEALALVKRGAGRTATPRRAPVPHTARPLPPQEHADLALVEIELCGELMIAAASSHADRLTSARIDEVLKVGEEADGRPTGSETPAARGTRRD